MKQKYYGILLITQETVLLMMFYTSTLSTRTVLFYTLYTCVCTLEGFMYS